MSTIFCKFLVTLALLQGLALPSMGHLPRTHCHMACGHCSGSGKCANDCPSAGSGKDNAGGAEYMCGGSGKCYYCSGKGEI